MGFDIELPSGDGQLRKAFRTRVPGLSVRFPAMDKVFEVKDLSATGLAVLDPAKGFTEGQDQEAELLINGRLFVRGCMARAMRVLDNGLVGLNFVDLDRHQQTRLDKLVLEVQKRLIELRKKRREQE